MIDRANNSASEQTDSEDLRVRNNENIRERIPETLEGKHTAIVTLSHVDKSTVKARGDGDTTLSDRNGSSDVRSRRRHSDIIPETREDVLTPHIGSPDSHHPPPAPVSPLVDVSRLDDSRHERESFEELESYRHEDTFSDAIKERSYDQRRSLLVTGRVLPPIQADQRNPQPQNYLVQTNELIFLPHDRPSSELEPSSESIPFPFYWPAEH